MVLLLELLLIKDLNGEDAVFVRAPGGVSALAYYSYHALTNIHIECFIPVWVQGLFDDLSGLGLFPTNGRNGERVGKAWSMSVGGTRRVSKLSPAYGRHLACTVHRRQ